MHLWEQQPDESHEQFRAFQCYLDKRSIDAAYRQYTENKKPQKAAKSRASSSFKLWAKAFNWKERVRAYEAHVQAEQTQADIQSRIEYVKERKDLYRDMAKAAHDMVKVKMADTKDVRLAELVEAAKYYDGEYQAEMERENLLKLREVMQ